MHCPNRSHCVEADMDMPTWAQGRNVLSPHFPKKKTTTSATRASRSTTPSHLPHCLQRDLPRHHQLYVQYRRELYQDTTSHHIAHRAVRRRPPRVLLSGRRLTALGVFGEALPFAPHAMLRDAENDIMVPCTWMLNYGRFPPLPSSPRQC